MSKKEVTILVTNDDGVGAPGIKAVAKALKALGNVWIVAPDRPQSAVGRAMTLHKPLRLMQQGRQIFSVNGTPSDCINLGLGKLLQSQRPALIVSGINKGVNLGDDVTNSGTVSGAMEGVLHGIPSIAVSQEDLEPCRYDVAAAYTVDLAQMVLQHGLPGDTLLNVNVPNCLSHQMEGVRFTSLSRRQYKNPVIEKVDPRGLYYYWIAGERISLQRQKPSDFDAVSKRMVSITPLHLDMTQYRALKTLRAWESVLNRNKKVSIQRGRPRAKRNRATRET